MIVTLQEVLDKYDWCLFCWIIGYDYYAPLSDKFNPEKEILLSNEEAEMIGATP